MSLNKHVLDLLTRAINGRVGDMYTKIPNFSNRDVSTMLLARLEKLNYVHRNPSNLKHQGGRERVIKYTSQEHTVFSALGNRSSYKETTE